MVASRQRPLHGNAGTRPPTAVVVPDPELDLALNDFAMLDGNSGQPPGGVVATPPLEEDSTISDELLAQMLQQEMLAELERDTANHHRADPFGSRLMSRKELDPDLYAPTVFTSSSPTGYASYAQMDDSLMEAYRDLNRQRGLDDSSDSDDSDDSDLEPYGGGGGVVANTGRRASPTSAVITILSTSEEDDDEEEEELHNRHRVSTGEMPNTVVVDDDEDDDSDDDDTIDTLDLNRLDSYPLKVLRQYCALEGVAVQGRSKKDYVSAILAYNDDMEDEDDDLELSITDLVERTRLDDSLASTDDDDHEELLVHPRRLPLASANRDRDRLHRRRVISEESENESESEGEKRESDGGYGATRIVALPDLVDDNVSDRAPPAPSPVGGRGGLVDYYQGLGGELSEEELLQMALRESMLEQQLRDGGGAITDIAVAPTAATDEELRADEELARALHDELNRSMSDERLARRFAQELRQEGYVAPMDDTTAILTSLNERTRELREQTEAARARLDDATDGSRRDRERQRRQLADAAVAAAAPAPTSYFRRNFTPVFSTIAPADVAAASTGGGDGERTRHRHRHRHRHGRFWDDPDADDDDVDPDAMTYEQLLALQERIGDVKKKGASVSTITSTTQTYVYHKPAGNTSDGNENAKCSVCMDDFAEGDEVRMLPCIHAYHRACIDQWLVKKAACPVCQRPIAGAAQ